MADILSLMRIARRENVRLDRDCLDRIYQRLGYHEADRFICRAVEEVAQLLNECHGLWSRGDWDALHQTVSAINRRASQIGMPALARLARDVLGCIQGGDRPAMDATLARMTRIGEASVAAAWGQADLSL